MLNEQVENVMATAFELARIREEHGAQSGMYLSEVRALRAEVERLAAQAAPTEIHADTPRHELLPRLRRLASDFQSHPLSRSISECEEAGIAMAEAAKQIEMLCHTRNTVVNHSGRMRKEIAALTEHRDFLLREIAKIDGDPGNACHYAIEAISAVCADLAEPVPPLPEPEPTYTDDLELRYAEAREERDHLRAVLRAQSPAQAPVQPVSLTDVLQAAAPAEIADALAPVVQAVQAGEYPPLPKLPTMTVLSELQSGTQEMVRLDVAHEAMRAYVDADRAARVSPAEKTARMLTVTEFNVGRFCLGEDECIAQGIDFSAYERGIADASAAFSRNT